MSKMDGITLREHMMNVVIGTGDDTDRLVLADMLTDAGRDGEAAIVLSGKPFKAEWHDKDDFATMHIVEGVSRFQQEREEEEARKADCGGETFDLFAEGV